MPERRRLFLGIDCSSPWGGVALFDEVKVVGSVCIEGSRHHPFQPVQWIDELLSSLNASPEELAGVGVTKGPGVFTGLRVGLAVAKGLAFSLNIPLYTMTSCEAIARCLPIKGLICSLLDARRGEFYAAIYRWNKGVIEPLTEVMLLSKKRVKEMEGKVLFVGPGVTAAEVEGVDLPLPVAALVARYTCDMVKKDEEPDDPSSVLPSYIRLSDAEANRGIQVV